MGWQCLLNVRPQFLVEAGVICGILAAVKAPRFSELNKVCVNDQTNEPYTGFVIGSLFKDGRWIYKLSISEDPRKLDSYDNWVPEEWCERTK